MLYEGKLQYLVKWVGYTDKDNSWEPKKNLMNAREAMEDYEKSQAKSLPPIKIEANNSQSTKNLEEKKQKMNNKKEQKKNELSKKEQSLSDEQQRQENVDLSEQKIELQNPALKGKSKIKLSILGVCQMQGNKVYCVLFENETKRKWFNRKELQPKYLPQICDFYENRVKFID